MDFSIQSFKTSGDRALLDPRTSIFAIIVISAVMIGGRLSGVEYALRVISCLIPAAFLLIQKNYKAGGIYLAIVLFAMIIEGTAVQTSSGAFNLILVSASGIISRFIPQLMMGYCFMKYTTVSEFISGMEKMHVPSVITIAMSVMFRFFPTIIEENRCVMEAMKMRKTKARKMSLVSKMEYELVPVMMQSVRISDELSQAAMTKGLGVGIRRTHIFEAKLRCRDYVMLLGLATVLALFIIY